MATNFTSTSFGTTPDDKAVVVDVYKKPPLEPVNVQPNKLVDGINGFLGEKTGIGSLIKNLSNNYLTTGKFLNFDKDTAIKAAAKALGIKNGDIYDIGGTTLNGLLKSKGFYGTGLGTYVNGISQSITGNSFEQNLAGGFKQVLVQVKELKSFVKKVEDADSFADFSKIISGIDSESNILRVLDLTEVAGTLKGLNDLSNSLGIGSVLDKLYSSKLETTEQKYYISGLIASGTTNWNDLATVDTLLDYLTGEQLLDANPDAIKRLVADFDATTEMPTPSKEAADALLARLVKIDSEWDRIDNTNIIDQDIFASFGTFAKESFLIAEYHTAPLAIASSTVSRDFEVAAKAKFEFLTL